LLHHVSYVTTTTTTTTTIIIRCVGRRNYVYFFALAWCGTIQYSCSVIGSLLLLTADHESSREAAAAVGSTGVWRLLLALYIALVRLSKEVVDTLLLLC